MLSKSNDGLTKMKKFIVRPLLLFFITFIICFCGIYIGSRYAIILLLGILLGLSFEGFGFGFSGSWRSMIEKRNPNGMLSHIISISIISIFVIPLLHFNKSSLHGVIAPIGFSMIIGSFIFGIGMQILKGCGSGILVNVGSGNPTALLALPFFASGSFFGAYNISWWSNFNFIKPIILQDWSGLFFTLGLLFFTFLILKFFSSPNHRRLPKKYFLASFLIAIIAILHLIVSGQPLGIVYGLGLWVAKFADVSGFDLSGSVFFNNEANIIRIKESIFTDITSLTSIGIILGSITLGLWKKNSFSKRIIFFSLKPTLIVITTAFLMGYSARLAFGCNIGALFSGISSGSLHGWLWFFSAFLGSYLGIKIRPYCGFIK